MPGISIPIIENLVHPAFGFLHRTADAANPQAGPFVALAPPSFGLFPAYGVALRLVSVGAFHGRDVSSPVEYDPPLGKVTVHFTDLDGLDIVQQREYWTYDNQAYFWDTPLPSLFVVYTQPDVVLDVWWFHT